MASKNKTGENPETGSEQVAILITPSTDEQPSSIQIGSQNYLQNNSNLSPEISTSSPSPNGRPLKSSSSDSEAPLIRRSITLKGRTRSGLGESSVDSKLIKKWVSMRSEAKTPRSPHSDGALPNEEEKKKQLDVVEVFDKVTKQLKAKKFKATAVKVVLELPVFLVILGFLICSFTVDGFKDKEFQGVKRWKWFLLLLVIFSGLLLTQWIVRFIVFLIEWNLWAKKNVVYFTHGLKNSVQVFIWLGAVLCTWVLLFRPDIKKNKKSKKTIDLITWTFVSLFVASFLRLVKNTFIKLLASSFHNNRFLDKIQESVFYHYVLQTLLGHPNPQKGGNKDCGGGNKKTLPLPRGSAEKKKAVVDWAKLYQTKKEQVPSWTTKFFMDVISNSGLMTMSEMLEKAVVDGEVELDDGLITSEEDAIAGAVGIFRNILRYSGYSKLHTSGTKQIDAEDIKNGYIVKDDLLQFFIPQEVDIFYPKLLEVAIDKHINVQAFCEWVVKIDKDRQALQHALNDNKTAVKQFNHILNGILVVIIIALWLLLTGIASTKILLFMSSQLVVAAFIFGNTCKTIFEAVIFVFVMHPFDVGDRCLINGIMMVVEEMSIFTTVFLKNDNEKVYYPNAVLATKAISNYYRSPDQWDSLEFAIDYSTPVEKIDDLRNEIQKYLANNQSSFWEKDYSLVAKEIENLNVIKMGLYFRYTINFQQVGDKSRLRSQVVLKVKTILDELGIKYHLLPQEIHLHKMKTQ